MAKKNEKRVRNDAVRFVEVWQENNGDRDAVAKALGVGVATVVGNYYKHRKNIKSLVPMQSKGRGSKKVDYVALEKLAKAKLKAPAKTSNKKEEAPKSED